MERSAPQNHPYSVVSRKNIPACRIICNNQREMVKYQTLHRFTAQLRKGDHFAGADALACQCTCASNGAEIDGMVADDCVLHLAAAFSLADHTAQPQIQQPRCKGVHPAGRGGAAGADCQPGRRLGRPRIIDGASLQRKRKRFARVKQSKQLFVSCVPRGIDHTAQRYGIKDTEPAGKAGKLRSILFIISHS